MMVKWIGKLSLLLKRLKDAWMDMLPMSSMSETRRQSLYQADVERENGDRRIRNHELLDPEAPEAREGWNATQITAHEALFPFSDNLTTLMFIAASDLSEAQRERLTSSLSLWGLEVTAYTFEAVTTVFVELVCTPKSSMENPSLRVNKHGSHTSRTFIVEDFIEDEFGQWATDEVTGEQGYVDDERSCFWTWDDKEYAWQSRPFKRRQVRRRTGKGKGKGGFKGTGRAFLGEVQAQDPELWQEYSVWWSKGKRGKKGFSKCNESCRKGGFRTSPPEKGSSSDYNSHKGKGKDQKGKGKEGAFPQSGFSASEISVEEEQDHPWDPGDWYSDYSVDSSTSAWYNARHFAWIASVPPDLAHHPTHVVLDLGCTRSIGSRTAIRRLQKYALYHGMTTEFCPCNSLFCWPNLRQKRVGKVAFFIFRQHLHVLPELMCLRRATCLSSSPFLR